MSGVLLSRFVLPTVALALAVLAVLAVLDRLGDSERGAARRALLMRAAELERSTLVPGSMLPCVDGSAGETVANACEKHVFASARNAAAAVAYMGARITLLREAHAFAGRGDARVGAALASTRRAVALDRYGIAAHVLSHRDGCTAQQCAAFAMLSDADVLKANLKAQTFDQYVSRYAARWEAPAGTGVPGAGPAVSALPETGAAPNAARAEVSPQAASVVRKPVSSQWDFPSADSIPAVSIMGPEPKLPKDLANRLERDTAQRRASVGRKAAKDAKGQDAAKRQETPQQAPGAPLNLAR